MSKKLFFTGNSTPSKAVCYGNHVQKGTIIAEFQSAFGFSQNCCFRSKECK